MRRRRLGIAGVSVSALLIVSGTVMGGTFRGTPGNDTLRGGAAADKIYGLAGNDRLFGGSGNDVLVGGPGKDLLVGGLGSDKLACGPGRDTAKADSSDKIASDCEVVKGLPSPAPPPQPPPPPPPPPLPDRAFGNGVRGGLAGVVGELTFVFEAQAGTPAASGHLQARSQTSRVEVGVRCLSVAGNRAAIGGVIEEVETSSGIPVGAFMAVWIEDNGTGSSDRMSSTLIFTSDELPMPFPGVELPPDFPNVCPAANVPDALAFLPLISGDLTVVDEP